MSTPEANNGTNTSNGQNVGQEGAGEGTQLPTSATLDQRLTADTGAQGAQGGEAAAAEQPAAEQPAAGGGTVVLQSAAAALGDKDLPDVAAALEKGDAGVKSALSQLLDYCVAMAPGKPQNQKTLEQHQLILLNSLYVLLSAEEKQFKLSMRALLAIFKANASKCFSPTARNRGLNQAELGVIDNKNMRFLTRIVDVLAITAGSNNVSAAKKHVDMKKLMEAMPTVRIRQNLTAYYSA